MCLIVAFSGLMIILGLSLLRDLVETQKEVDSIFDNMSEPKWR